MQIFGYDEEKKKIPDPNLDSAYPAGIPCKKANENVHLIVSLREPTRLQHMNIFYFFEVVPSVALACFASSSYDKNANWIVSKSTNSCVFVHRLYPRILHCTTN